MIKDEVVFNNNEWSEIPLTNEEIESKLKDEKDKAFLSFRLWMLGDADIGRDNLIRNLIQVDDYVVYGDTDSLKLRQRI